MCRARNSAAVCPGSKVHLAMAETSLETDLTLHCSSRPLHKYPGEVLAKRIEHNEPQDYYNDCQRYTTWIQKHVIQNYVHNYWSKKHKSKGHEPIHKQQRTACNLQRSDNPKVMRLCECTDKLSCQSCRHRAHVEEIEKTIQPKHNED
jgi:hypothetical protein